MFNTVRRYTYHNLQMEERVMEEKEMVVQEWEQELEQVLERGIHLH